MREYELTNSVDTGKLAEKDHDVGIDKGTSGAGDTEDILASSLYSNKR